MGEELCSVLYCREENVSCFLMLVLVSDLLHIRFPILLVFNCRLLKSWK